MAPRKTQTKNWRELDEQISLWTTIRMRKWVKCANGLIRTPQEWDELNKNLRPCSIAEAAKAHGLEINPKTGALVYDGQDVEGTDDATWNRAPAPGAQPPSVRLAILDIRAKSVGVRMPDSNSLDDYERMILEAEAVSKGQQMPPDERLTILNSVDHSQGASAPQAAAAPAPVGE